MIGGNIKPTNQINNKANTIYFSENRFNVLLVLMCLSIIFLLILLGLLNPKEADPIIAPWFLWTIGIISAVIFSKLYFSCTYQYIVNFKQNQILKQTKIFGKISQKTILNLNQIKLICVSTIAKQYVSHRDADGMPIYRIKSNKGKVITYYSYELLAFDKSNRKYTLSVDSNMDKLNNIARQISENIGCDFIEGDNINKIDLDGNKKVFTTTGKQIKDLNSVNPLNIVLGLVFAIGGIFLFFYILNKVI